MVARWYRPPEIILGDRHYDSKVDVWSTGCIIAELIQVFNKSNDEERVLFKGGSCFSNSPLFVKDKNNKELNISSDD